MTDAAYEIYAAGLRYRSIGTLIGGLVALKSLADELFVFLPAETLRIASADMTLTEAGIVGAGRMIVPFDGARPWERYGGPDGTSVSFTLSDGTDGLIAPATRPDGMDVGRIVKLFVDECRSDDQIFLQDVAGYVPSSSDHPDERLNATWRSGDAERYGDDDVLTVLGNRIPLGGMTWAESETDSDGNRHLHVVMADGRYRRIGAGDFSR